MMHKTIPLKEISKVFFKLGTVGFGGPAAHIAMMREEVVARHQWMKEQEFFDLVGATHLIPGPNSTELAIHIGHRLGGWKGLLTAGICFIFPAFLAVLTVAIFYVKYGSLPELGHIMAGIKPVIVAIVLTALFNFRKTAVPNFKMGFICLLGILFAVFGLNEILTLLFLSTAYGVFTVKVKPKIALEPISISLFLFFLKIGSVLFGSGYVLLAFLQNELVTERMWLTQTQLLDAVAVGQFTPGPVFTTATFVGYLINGNIGAVLATIGIFLPSFFFVFISAPYLHKLRDSFFFSHFLDAINAVSFSLMLVVCFSFSKSSLISPLTIGLCLVSLGILFKFKKINSAWLIILGGLVGYFFFN